MWRMYFMEVVVFGREKEYGFRQPEGNPGHVGTRWREVCHRELRLQVYVSSAISAGISVWRPADVGA